MEDEKVESLLKEYHNIVEKIKINLKEDDFEGWKKNKIETDIIFFQVLSLKYKEKYKNHENRYKEEVLKKYQNINIYNNFIEDKNKIK
jgi:hypothetical protein